MSTFDFYNLVFTVLMGGLCFSLTLSWRKYRKQWMNRGVNIALGLAVLSFLFSLSRH